LEKIGNTSTLLSLVERLPSCALVKSLYTANMSTDLKSALRAEANKLADQFYDTALRLLSAQLTGLLGPPNQPGSMRDRASTPAGAQGGEERKRTRSSREQIETALASIIETLATSPSGLRKEQLAKALETTGPALTRAVKLGLASDQLKKKGNRRSTVYFLPSMAQAQGRVVRKKKPT
jgi:hypothetical protein